LQISSSSSMIKIFLGILLPPDGFYYKTRRLCPGTIISQSRRGMMGARKTRVFDRFIQSLIFISPTLSPVGKITGIKHSEGGHDHKFFL